MVWSPCIGSSAGCVLLSTTVPAPGIRQQALLARSFVFDRILSLRVLERGMKLWKSPKLISGNCAPVYPGHLLYRLAPRQHIFEVNLDSSSVLSNRHTIIVGYWVGPESEDGWGYIEAAVNRVFKC